MALRIWRQIFNVTSYVSYDGPHLPFSSDLDCFFSPSWAKDFVFYFCFLFFFTLCSWFSISPHVLGYNGICLTFLNYLFLCLNLFSLLASLFLFSSWFFFFSDFAIEFIRFTSPHPNPELRLKTFLSRHLFFQGPFKNYVAVLKNYDTWFRQIQLILFRHSGCTDVLFEWSLMNPVEQKHVDRSWRLNETFKKYENDENEQKSRR